ncbi:MAG: Rieske 2Fe-2S domain-containing protein [Pseudomonadota bacterium]
MEQKVCLLTDICDGQGKAFSLNDNTSFFIVRQGLEAFAYINRCPHAGVELQWQADQFMSLDGSQIQCALHGALFNIQNGLCTWGPCQGRQLQPFPISIRDGWIIREDNNHEI